MSGTSLDGVDAAVVVTDGERIVAFGDTAYRPYSEDERAAITEALGCWPGDRGVDAAAEVVETAHAELMARFDGIDIAGFHGQTLAHEPRGRGTHQAGDGDVLAKALGLPVVWDFRSTDIRLGGQGAPLAPFFHFACARWIGAKAPVAFVNLGGVGNLTWVDPSRDRPEDTGALLAFDTGPANAPLNDLMRARRGVECDRDGALGSQGVVDEAIIAAFLEHPHFHRMPPKSLDRNAFSDLMAQVAQLSDADAAATLTAAAASAVAAGLEHCPVPPERLLITGGGRLNPLMMAMLVERTGVAAVQVEDVGLDGDMLEAQAFAFLAVRVARGLATSCPGTTGVAAAVGGGKISHPA
ncbi:anhydro-N-acetylmuramic acid kinase [Rhodovulum bhavnagarense]|uniref:Anhydro-N-acetylmuramic acid kinase n=2 Tax=Rhodovulum bhavnagarense TaxID=992286 RepID=A0A4R2RS08_9RHOB|nr:anhydro-N-acetylmuramic acid kinase [Rhodovulum bhavnagarense]